MTRIGSFAAKGIAPFRDEGDPKDQGRTGGLAFFEVEFALEQEARKGKPERRGHSRGHHRRHGRVDLAREQSYGESIRGLVNGPAHVETPSSRPG